MSRPGPARPPGFPRCGCGALKVREIDSTSLKSRWARWVASPFHSRFCLREDLRPPTGPEGRAPSVAFAQVPGWGRAQGDHSFLELCSRDSDLPAERRKCCVFVHVCVHTCACMCVHVCVHAHSTKHRDEPGCPSRLRSGCSPGPAGGAALGAAHRRPNPRRPASQHGSWEILRDVLPLNLKLLDPRRWSSLP